MWLAATNGFSLGWGKKERMWIQAVASAVVLVHAFTTDVTAVPVTTIAKARFALVTAAVDADVHVCPHKPLVAVLAGASMKSPSAFLPGGVVEKLLDDELALARHKHKRPVLAPAHLVAHEHVRRTK